MDGTYRFDETNVPSGDHGSQAFLSRLRSRGQALSERALALVPALRTHLPALRTHLPKSVSLAPLNSAVAHLGATRAKLPALVDAAHRASDALTSFARGNKGTTAVASDAATAVLSDFDSLSAEQKDAVAKNLARLWECFVDEFDGPSGFQASAPIEQAAYVSKLENAAKRMESFRDSEAGHHFVCVVLMQQYVSSFQLRSREPSAIRLSNHVAAQIDRGRRLAV